VKFVDDGRRRRHVYDKKSQRYDKDNRTAFARSDKSVAYVTTIITGSNIPWVTEMRYLGGLLCAIQEFEMFVNYRQARFLSGS